MPVTAMRAPPDSELFIQFPKNLPAPYYRPSQRAAGLNLKNRHLLRVLLYLYLEAAYQDSLNGIIKRGQLVSDTSTIADATGRTYNHVKQAIRTLIKDGYISTQLLKEGRYSKTLFTVTLYDSPKGDGKAWFKVFRSWKNWEWFDDDEMLALRLLLNNDAKHESWRKEQLSLKRGQAIVGRNATASRLGFTPDIWRNRLKKMEQSGVIETETIHRKGTIITIKGYGSHDATDTSIHSNIANSNLDHLNTQPPPNKRPCKCLEARGTERQLQKNCPTYSHEFAPPNPQCSPTYKNRINGVANSSPISPQKEFKELHDHSSTPRSPSRESRVRKRNFSIPGIDDELVDRTSAFIDSLMPQWLDSDWTEKDKIALAKNLRSDEWSLRALDQKRIDGLRRYFRDSLFKNCQRPIFRHYFITGLKLYIIDMEEVELASTTKRRTEPINTTLAPSYVVAQLPKKLANYLSETHSAMENRISHAATESTEHLDRYDPTVHGD